MDKNRIQGDVGVTQEEFFVDDPTRAKPDASLQLNGMVRALKEQWMLPDNHSLSFDERLGLLLERELAWRGNKRLIATLVNGDWLRPRHNLARMRPET